MKRKNIQKIIVIAANVLIVGVILVILLTYFRSETQNRTERNREQFEAVTLSVAQAIFGRLEEHQELVSSAAGYINGRGMTMEEAISYAAEINNDENHMFHIVWTDDLTGLSTKASKLDASDYTVDYSKISSTRLESTTMIAAMSILYEESRDKFIHATRAFNNPTDAESTVAFFDKVTLLRDGEPAEAMLMLLTGVEDLRSEYEFPEGIFANTQTAIIDTDSGYYVISTPELKNTSFFEYLREYNDLDYPTLQALEARIAAGETVAVTYKNYRGEDTRFIISNVENADGWTLVSFLPESELNALSDDNLFKITMEVVLLILFLLICDLLYFVSLNNVLEKTLGREKLAKEEAEQANRSKTDFLSTMSHDIRTPLNAILGLTELTKKRTEEPEAVAEYLGKIEQSGKHLLTLINDILDISKIESGKLNITPGPFALMEVDDYLKSLCQPAAQGKELHLTIRTEQVSEKQLYGDKLRIYQVFINILTNALKYTDAGGTVEAVLKESLIDEEHARLCYTVTDTGIGMTPEFMEHMYENFSRAKDGRIDKVQGTGLGLAICKRIVDAMEGRIACESKPGEGTTFTVTLSLPLVEAGQADNNNNNNGEGLPEQLHLLVAEDNDLNWDILSEMLEDENITCERAENGREAVDRLKGTPEGTYSLVLMDIQMPVLNGLEATKEIRALEREDLKKLPIIALTADAFAENIEECRSAGMNSHVAKPVNLEVLLREIKRVLK